MRIFLKNLPLVLLLAIFAGCRTPMPPGNATSGLRLGPFFETATADDGSSTLAIRPFYSTESSGGDATDARAETDILWPLGISSQRGDHSYWRALLLYGTDVDDDPTSPNDPYRFRAFPFVFFGRTLQGGDYAAVFPFGGTIRNFLFFNEVSFVLFPIYASGNTAGVEMKTFLWPFYLERHGKHVDQLRLWPFYGEYEHRGLHMTSRSHFVLWPFWTDYESYGTVAGGGFILFPFFGHSYYEREKRGVEESWSILPPLFTFGRGDDGYRKINAPWPFVRILDRDNRRERHFWPLYGSAQRTGSDRKYYLWPFFSETEITANAMTNRFLHIAMPLYFHREHVTADVNGSGKNRRSYSRLWPLFSYRDNGNDTTVRFPELSLWSGNEQVERNWAPLWSLYTYRKKNDGAYCNDLLWGLCSWGRNSEGGRIFSILWIPFAR